VPAEEGGVRYAVHATIGLAGEEGALYQREAMFFCARRRNSATGLASRPAWR
jgi:tetrahydromethanopterin S-methyltransferase subunit E